MTVPRLLLLLNVLLFPSQAFAMTGNTWNTMTKAVQSFYIAGVIDGWREASISEEDLREGGGKMTRMVACLSIGMPRSQIIAVVEKYMKDHPEAWHLEMSTLILLALSEMCSR